MRSVHILRKPCSEATVVANVHKYGTGALNVDATRIRHSSPDDLDKHVKMVAAIKARGGSMENSWENSSPLSGASDVSTGGRWPANVIFQHTGKCRNDVCAPDCPVAALDAQSGTSQSASGVVKYVRAETTGWKERGGSFTPGHTWEATAYGDKGGASRYFKRVGA
jgi:hypothetical protein